MPPKSAVKAMAAEYEQQIKQLKKSLVSVTVDRDILKATIDLASKKS